MGALTDKDIAQQVGGMAKGALNQATWGFGDKIIEKVDENSGNAVTKFLNWLSEVLGPVFSYISEFINSIVSGFREWFSPETVAAETGLQAEIDRSPVFAKVEQDIGIAGSGDHLRKLAKQAVESGVEGNAVENAASLYKSIGNYVLEDLKQKNPKWTNEDIAKFREVAAHAAAAITGLPAGVDVNDINPNLLTSGYVGLLQQTKEQIKAPGTFTAGEVGTLTLQEAVTAAAPVAQDTSASDVQVPPQALAVAQNPLSLNMGAVGAKGA